MPTIKQRFCARTCGLCGGGADNNARGGDKQPAADRVASKDETEEEEEAAARDETEEEEEGEAAATDNHKGSGHEDANSDNGRGFEIAPERPIILHNAPLQHHRHQRRRR